MPQTAGPARTTDPSPLRPHHVRTLALAGAVVGVVLLPIAAAQATPPSQGRETQAGSPVAGADQSAAAQGSATPSASGSPSADAGAQALTPEYCGTPLTKTVTGGALHVQVCVDQSAGSAFARAYVANETATAQVVALNLVRSDGSVVSVQCTIAVGDSAGQCDTSPTSISAGSGGYNAVAELVAQGSPVSAGVLHVESGLVAPTAS